MDDYGVYRKKSEAAKAKKRRGLPPTPPASGVAGAPEQRWPKNLIVVGGNAAQCKARQRELIDEFGDQVSGNWILISTANRAGASDKLRGRKLVPGDLIDFYGTWDEGVSAQRTLDDLKAAGWNGDRISEVVRRRNARAFERAKVEALELAREIHSPPDA